MAVLRTAVEKSPVPNAVTDAAGFHRWHNPAFDRLFGYEDEDLEQCLPDILPAGPADRQKVSGILACGSSGSFPCRVKEKSGRCIDIELTIEPVENGNGKSGSFVWIFEDITEYKKIKKERSFQHEYQSTVQTISLGMFRRLDLPDLLRAIVIRASKLARIPNGFLYLYNPEEQLLEVKAACGVLKDRVGTKIKPGEGISGKVFQKGEPMIVDDYRTWPEKEQSRFYDNVHSIVCIPLTFGSKTAGVIGLSYDKQDFVINPDIVRILEEFSAIAQIAIDNTALFENQKVELEKRIAVEKERKKIETALYQAQRMDSIGTLAGGIAHDFNNILSAIIGYTQIAMDGIGEDNPARNDLDEIYTASLRAKDLVRQILTFARQSDDRLSPVKVSMIAKEVLTFIRSSIPETIDIRYNMATNARVLANPTQLYQVFLNLFTNAAHAMRDTGGVLRVETSWETLPEQTGGDYVKVKVADTGTGIAKEHVQNIFEPYFTTKSVGQGTGLGLSVVHGAVKSMKGDIRVESVQGEGTCFTIHLPVSKDSKEKLR